jgi:hypothetical protein
VKLDELVEPFGMVTDGALSVPWLGGEFDNNTVIAAPVLLAINAPVPSTSDTEPVNVAPLATAAGQTTPVCHTIALGLGIVVVVVDVGALVVVVLVVVVVVEVVVVVVVEVVVVVVVGATVDVVVVEVVVVVGEEVVVVTGMVMVNNNVGPPATGTSVGGCAG